MSETRTYLPCLPVEERSRGITHGDDRLPPNSGSY